MSVFATEGGKGIECPLESLPNLVEVPASRTRVPSALSWTLSLDGGVSLGGPQRVSVSRRKTLRAPPVSRSQSKAGRAGDHRCGENVFTHICDGLGRFEAVREVSPEKKGVRNGGGHDLAGSLVRYPGEYDGAAIHGLFMHEVGEEFARVC